MKRDSIAGAFRNLHAVVDRISRARRNQMHINHRSRGPRISLVDAVAARIYLQRAVEMRALLHRAFAVVFDASAPEYGLAFVVGSLQFEPGIVGINRATRKEMPDFLGSNHHIHPNRISSTDGWLYAVEGRCDWNDLSVHTRGDLHLRLFADREGRRQIRPVG